MTRKLVRTGSSLAVTLPSDFVAAHKLRKGDEVEVSVHPQTGAVTIRTGIRVIDGGKVSKRVTAASKRIMQKYDAAFKELAK